MPSFFCGKCLFCFCTASFDSAIPGVFLSHPSSLFRRKKNSFAGVCPGSISFAPPRGEEYAAVANVRKYFCPLPPTRARRALFPRWGRGSFCYLCKGLRPLQPRACARVARVRRAVSAPFREYGERPPCSGKSYPFPTGKGAAKERGGTGGRETSAPEMVLSPRGGERIGCREQRFAKLFCPPSPAWEERSASAGRGDGGKNSIRRQESGENAGRAGALKESPHNTGRAIAPSVLRGEALKKAPGLRQMPATFPLTNAPRLAIIGGNPPPRPAAEHRRQALTVTRRQGGEPYT